MANVSKPDPTPGALVAMVFLLGLFQAWRGQTILATLMLLAAAGCALVLWVKKRKRDADGS